MLAVFKFIGRALQGVYGQLNSGIYRLLGAMGVLVGKEIMNMLHQAVLAGNATLSVGEFHRVRLRVRAGPQTCSPTRAWLHGH